VLFLLLLIKIQKNDDVSMLLLSAMRRVALRCERINQPPTVDKIDLGCEAA